MWNFIDKFVFSYKHKTLHFKICKKRLMFGIKRLFLPFGFQSPQAIGELETWSWNSKLTSSSSLER